MLPKVFPFDPLAFGLDIARQYGDIAYYKAGPLHVYQLAHPDLARQILVEQPEKFVKSRFITRAFRPFAGDGLLTSDGALWRQQRKLIQPAFHRGRLATYGDVMVARAVQTADSFEDGHVIEIDVEMAKLTLGIVVKTLFGADFTRESEEVSGLMVAVLNAANQRLNGVLRPPSWVPTPRNLREKRALARLDEMLHGVITTRRTSGEQRADLLSVLLAAVDEESGTRMSDRQLRDEMMTLFLAGHETTANALTWTWFLLSQNPAAEAGLFAEVDRMLGGRPPSVEDIPALRFTEQVFAESMRLYPPAWGVGRKAIRDQEIGGYRVPAGALVVMSAFVTQRDPRFFPDPGRFDPARFTAEARAARPRFAYFPFGGGARQCIGEPFAWMEGVLILATIAQGWRLRLLPGHRVEPQALITLRPRYGMRMVAERRRS